MEDLTTDEMIAILIDETTGRDPVGPEAPEFRSLIRKDIALAEENNWQIEIPAEWQVELAE